MNFINSPACAWSSWCRMPSHRWAISQGFRNRWNAAFRTTWWSIPGASPAPEPAAGIASYGEPICSISTDRRRRLPPPSSRGAGSGRSTTSPQLRRQSPPSLPPWESEIEGGTRMWWNKRDKNRRTATNEGNASEKEKFLREKKNWGFSNWRKRMEIWVWILKRSREEQKMSVFRCVEGDTWECNNWTRSFGQLRRSKWL